MQGIPPNRRKCVRPTKSWKEGITKAMSGRDLRVGQWNSRKQWKLGIGPRRKMLYIYIHIYTYLFFVY